MFGSSLTKLTPSLTSLTISIYTRSTTTARTATITTAVMAFRLTFSFSSKKRTTGEAIREISHPMINGIKNQMHLGKRKIHKSTMASAVNKFKTTFKYILMAFLINTPLFQSDRVMYNQFASCTISLRPVQSDCVLYNRFKQLVYFLSSLFA